MKKLLIALGVMGFMFFFCAGFFVYRIGTMDMSEFEKSLPGHAGFEAANQQIGSFKGEEAFGNTDQAKLLAAAFAKLTKTANDASFSGGKKGGLSMTDGHFLTYCQLNEDSACFLVHVPQLKRYKKEVRDSLIEQCWTSARLVLKEATDEEIELAVGLRGSVTYGGSAIGQSSSDSPVTENSFMVSSMTFHKYFVAPDGDDSVEEGEVTDEEQPADESAPDDQSAPDEESAAEEQPAEEESVREEAGSVGQEEPVGK